MRILVVIVNYRAGDLVVECLRTLADELPRVGSHQVVVVDNHSPNGDAQLLATAISTNRWHGWVRLVPAAENRGFAAGNNLGMAPALASADPPDYVLLLNPDTWVRPGSIQALLAYQDAHREAAIAGSLLEDPDGTPQHCRFRFPDPINELSVGLKLGLIGRLWPRRMSCPPFATEPHRIDWVSGAAMSIRRDVIERIGLFDEGYFLYFEELDFCRRAADAGFQSWHVPQSHVVHLVGRSTGVTVRERRPDRVPPYWFASRRRYFRKHHGICYRILCHVAHAGGHAVDSLRRLVTRRPATRPPCYLRDFVRHTLLPGVQR